MTIELPNRISYDKIQKHLSDLQIKKNRVNNQINLEKRKNTSQHNVTRKKRTRTLIQLGGLVNLSGLPEICDIQDGDDLQFDLIESDKAATLLGILVTCVENFRNDLSHEHLEHFKQKGIAILKRSSYKRHMI